MSCGSGLPQRPKPDPVRLTPVTSYFSSENRNNLSSYTGLPTIIVPGGFYPCDGMPFGVHS